MSFVRKCKKCGEKISIRKMPNGKWVPYDFGTDVCHLDTCKASKKKKTSRKKAAQKAVENKSFNVKKITEEFKKAIEDDKLILLDYQDAKGRKTIRFVKPLYFYRSIYLRTFCYKRYDERTFRLDRIINYEIVEPPSETEPEIEFNYDTSADLPEEDYCTECGTVLEEDDIYCVGCGAKREEPYSAPTAQLPTYTATPTNWLPELPDEDEDKEKYEVFTGLEVSSAPSKEDVKKTFFNFARVGDIYGMENILSSLSFERKHKMMNAKDENGYAPVHIATVNGRQEAVAFFINKHADVKAKTYNGETPLDLARKYKYPTIEALFAPPKPKVKPKPPRPAPPPIPKPKAVKPSVSPPAKSYTRTYKKTAAAAPSSSSSSKKSNETGCVFLFIILAFIFTFTIIYYQNSKDKNVNYNIKYTSTSISKASPTPTFNFDDLETFQIPSPSPTQGFVEALCTRIIDGDTIEITLPDGQKQKVRLIGIDCAEKGESEWYFKSSSYTMKNLLNKRISILPGEKGHDGFGRLLGYVWVNGRFFNDMIVREGYAKVYTKYKFNQEYKDKLLQAQRAAKKYKRGMWAEN